MLLIYGLINSKRNKMNKETLEEEMYKASFANESPLWHDGFIAGVKWQKEQKVNILDKVNRVEVIQHSPPHNGRAYTNYNAKDVEIQFQDDGKTLKIFLI